MTHYSIKQASNNDISENEDTQNHVQFNNLEANLSQNNDVKTPVHNMTEQRCKKCSRLLSQHEHIKGKMYLEIRKRQEKREEEQEEETGEITTTDNQVF